MVIKLNNNNGSFNIDSLGKLVKLNNDTVITLNNIYPVGAIYISTLNISPASFLRNTAWEALPEGYTLLSVTSGDGGGKLDPGLPNISGSFNATVYTSSSVSGQGAFQVIGDSNSAGRSAQNGAYYFKDGSYEFKASRDNGIYGRSNTVQPPAIKVFMWKRIS